MIATSGSHTKHSGVMLWDFDQYAVYDRNTLITFFTNLLKRLEADGVVRSILEVHTIAFGLPQSFAVPFVTSALTNMCVEMRLVSDAKREETDRQLERAAREYANDPAVEAIMILSSDKDFNGLVRDLRRLANKRVYVVHNAPRGSPHEELLSLYATGTYRIDDFVSSPQRSNFGATGTVRQGAPPSYAESQQKLVSPVNYGVKVASAVDEGRSSIADPPVPVQWHSGTVVRWEREAYGGGCCGYVSDEAVPEGRVFLRSANYRGGSIEVGTRVIFRIKERGNEGDGFEAVHASSYIY